MRATTRRAVFFTMLVLPPVLVAVGAACSLAIDTSGLSDPSAPPVDGAAPVTDARTDGPGLVDGGSDSAPPIENCEAALCDDFDRDPLGARWTTVVQNGGKLALDSDVSFSPPRSLVATSDGGSSTTRRAQLEKTFKASAVDCRIRVRLDSTNSATADVNVLEVYARDKSGREIDLAFTLKPGELGVAELYGKVDAGGFNRNVAIGPHTAGTWLALRVVTDMKTVRWLQDDVLLREGTLGSSPVTDLEVRVGIYDGEGAAWVVHIDDVVCATP